MQRRRPDARALLYERIRTSPPKFVHVVGVPYTIEIAPSAEPADPAKSAAPAESTDSAEPAKTAEPEQIWLTLETPPLGRIRVAINTLSKLSRDAGQEHRIRMAVETSAWTEKPQTGLIEAEGQSYAVLEAASKVKYELQSPAELAASLAAKAKTAVRAEVWGELYAKDHLGVRQVHSRRASKAVREDVAGRDGALKLYYSEGNQAELFLFKFEGQP